MTDDELALECKRKEIEALEEVKKGIRDCVECHYFDGKASAYADIWELIVFNGKPDSAKEYNRANKNWSRLVAEDQLEKEG